MLLWLCSEEKRERGILCEKGLYPLASWEPNGTYVIKRGVIVCKEKNGDIYHFEIEDDETLVFNA